ncbi:MAG: hypothetical protein C4K47_08360 [Candidatus Thorarchaeota archaeon]|nr:MAG: hypothetical protein C4K47_08360 [Candidatus Thorarchaeota archaeon]
MHSHHPILEPGECDVIVHESLGRTRMIVLMLRRNRNLTVVKGIIREVGRSTTVSVSAQRWYGFTNIVVQDEVTEKTYDVHLSSAVMTKCRFLPRVGMKVVVNGYVEKSEYGLSDYLVTKVVDVKHEGSGILRVHRLDPD